MPAHSRIEGASRSKLAADRNDLDEFCRGAASIINRARAPNRGGLVQRQLAPGLVRLAHGQRHEHSDDVFDRVMVWIKATRWCGFEDVSTFVQLGLTRRHRIGPPTGSADPARRFLDRKYSKLDVKLGSKW